MILEIVFYAQVFTSRVCTILDWRAARHLVSFFAVHFSWLHSIRSSVRRMRNSASNCLLPPPLCRCLAGRGTTQKPINNAQLSPARGAWTEREQACTKYLVNLVGVVTVSRSGNMGSRRPALWGPTRKRVKHRFIWHSSALSFKLLFLLKKIVLWSVFFFMKLSCFF